MFLHMATVYYQTKLNLCFWLRLASPLALVIYTLVSYADSW